MSVAPVRLAPSPWPAEDGGPSRLGHIAVPGPRAGSGRLAAVRHDPLCVMLVHGLDGALFLLRKTMGPGGWSWVEEIDAFSLEVVRRSPDLEVGPFWPGGLAAFGDGSVIVVQGRYVHRLHADLSIDCSVEMPVDAAHNSFVVLADGSIALKDLQRPDGPPSTLSILDPVTLATRGALVLPEPSVARISAHENEIVVVGVTSLHRVAWDPEAGSLEPVIEPVRYRTHDDQSFGWDPVIAAGSIWWMDNGDHTFERTLSMLDNGVAAGPVRLWKAALDGSAFDSVEICGQANGAITNPPLIDPERGLAVGYDSANGVMAAFDAATLEPRWSIAIDTAQHLMLYADTGEIIADDHDPAAGDQLAVVDITDGSRRVTVPIGSPAQSVVFGAPGTRRDAYYVSLSTIARVEFSD